MSKAITINPATGETVATYKRIKQKKVYKKIEKAKKAQHKWKDTSFEQRSKLMLALAKILKDNAEEYAQLMTTEMGKVIEQARAEVKKCAWICEYYAEHAETFLATEIVKTEASKSFVSYQPIGVILAIMPWNFPFYQVIRFIVPALMAGNTGVLKHASNVQGCALELEKAFNKAGFPSGVFTNLNISIDQIEGVIEHRAIAAVTLTGSDAAGRAVASIAGKNLKKTVMELGGSDAYIILDDVNMEEALELATYGRLKNTGQTCIAAKRLIVLDSIYDEFLKKYTKKMKAAKMGKPTKEDSYYGPMARHDLRDDLHKQVKKSIKQGAKLVLGGKIPKHKGAYYPATILSEVKPGMEAFEEELFGPVASVIRAKDEAEAIKLANNSQFGLGAGVITGDAKRGEKIALQLEAGNCFVNKLVSSDPRMPFGGVKNSGYGRELSDFGIREFVNIKSVWIK